MAALFPYGFGRMAMPRQQAGGSVDSGWGMPTTYGGYGLSPQGAVMMAQAQGGFMANSYLPSIMQSLGFDAPGSQVRELLAKQPTAAEQQVSQAETDGDYYLWKVDQFGQPRRWHRSLWYTGQSGREPREGAITGKQAAELLRARLPKPSDAQPVMSNPLPPRGAMSMSDFWGR